MEMSNDSLEYAEFMMKRKMLKPNQKAQESNQW